MLVDPPLFVTPGVNSFRSMSMAKDFCFNVAPGSESMLRNNIISPYMSDVAAKLLETCLNNLWVAL